MEKIFILSDLHGKGPSASAAIWENGSFSLKRVEYRVEETVAGLARVFRGTLLDELAGFLRKGG